MFLWGVSRAMRRRAAGARKEFDTAAQQPGLLAGDSVALFGCRNAQRSLAGSPRPLKAVLSRMVGRAGQAVVDRCAYGLCAERAFPTSGLPQEAVRRTLRCTGLRRQGQPSIRGAPPSLLDDALPSPLAIAHACRVAVEVCTGRSDRGADRACTLCLKPDCG